MSREIPLTKGRVALVDESDAAWACAHRWHITSDHGSRLGYARSHVAGPMHRALTDAAPHEVVDHINGDTLDNRRENLRICSAKENHRNRRAHSPNKVGFKGVTKNKGSATYRAVIVVDGALISCGSFTTAFEAAAAYDRAAKKHFGEFARFNFSPERDWLLPYRSCSAPEPRSFGGGQ